MVKWEIRDPSQRIARTNVAVCGWAEPAPRTDTTVLIEHLATALPRCRVSVNASERQMTETDRTRPYWTAYRNGAELVPSPILTPLNTI